MLNILLAANETDDFFGTIESPAVIKAYGESGGLITLANNLLVLAVIVGGVIALYNIVLAGYVYLTGGGDTKAHEKVMSKITQSLWGMVIMIMAPALMAVVGFVLFKNASFFLKPQIVGVDTPRAMPERSETVPGRSTDAERQP